VICDHGTRDGLAHPGPADVAERTRAINYMWSAQQARVYRALKPLAARLGQCHAGRTEQITNEGVNLRD
jgi:hypothetical protein